MKIRGTIFCHCATSNDWSKSRREEEELIMLKADVKLILNREPFVPLRLYLANGKVFNIGFRDVVRILE